jgi:preprotein translocase subunit YajC
VSLHLYFDEPTGPAPVSNTQSGATGTQTGAQVPGAAPAAQGSPSMLPMLLPFALFIPILFLMFRRQKKEQEQRKSLKRGDRVVSTSGLIGELMELDERIAKVKIAPGTTVQMLVNTVSPLPDAAPAAAVDKELKDAKAVSDKK